MEPAMAISQASAVEVQESGISWAAIAAGSVVAAALSLALVAFGSGLGLSAVSPWADFGVSATAFKVSAGSDLCVVAVMASSVGGYLAARLRTRWVGLHTNEIYFRDTAHGLVAWALATVLTASVLAPAHSNILGGAAQGAGIAAAQSAQSTNSAEIYVDRLFRTDTTMQPVGGLQPAVGNAVAGRSDTL